jgi:DNA replication and repair protein RecF
VHLAWIEARDFRNYHEVSLEVDPGLTAAVGPNAQGKTNLLEAMHYLCSLESPRVSSDLPLVRMDPATGESPQSGPRSAFVRGEVESAVGRALIEVEVKASGANRVQVNRSSVRRKRDLRRHVRAVFCGPDDLSIVLGDPDQRRRFMDEAVRTQWPAREGVASAYERALRQRNRLLKEWDGEGQPPALAGWDGELVAHGAELTSLRARAVDALSRRTASEFEALTGGSEEFHVQYRPSVEGADEALQEAFFHLLAERRHDELVRRTTLVGPHRDELGLVVRGLTARTFASHGEAWAAAVCLRLALAGAVAEEIGEPPILFLDDPFSGLDPARRRRLADGLRGRGQVVTALPDESQLPEGATVWFVKEGRVQPG